MALRTDVAGRFSSIFNGRMGRMNRMKTMTVLAALVLPFAIWRAGASAGDAKTKQPAAENPRPESAPEGNAAADAKEPDWSDPIGGLAFRLTAPRTVFQAWELPTLAIEVRNTADVAVTARAVKQIFQSAKHSGLEFLFKDQYKRAPNPNRSLVPEVRLDPMKFVGLKPGETMTETGTLAATREQHPFLLDSYPLTAGRYTLGLGVLGARLAVELKTNDVTLTILPPGVQDRKELARYVKPLSVGEWPILAGFVPNKTTLVVGEPMLATFMVENRGEQPFSFEMGGHQRGPRNYRFEIDAIGPDGKQVADPAKGGDGGGKGNSQTAQGHDAAVATVELLKYRAISKPGKFQVTCRFVLTPGWPDRGKQDFNVPVETTYELTILPRELATVRRVLEPWFVEANQTGSLALDERIETIASFGQESAVAGLTTMGTDGDVEHRVAAAKGLRKIATPNAIDALLQLNRDKALEVRAAVIASLGAFTDDRAVDAVVQALSDSNEPLRKTAATALGQMKTAVAVDALIERLPTSDPELSAAILRAMGTSRSPRVFEIIVQSLASENGAIWRAALDAIVNFPAEDAADALRPYATTNPKVKKLAESPKEPVDLDPDVDPREAELRKMMEKLDQSTETDPDMDFREAVIKVLAESLHQPIEMDWLTPVIQSRKGTNSIGDAPRLMRLYDGQQAVPALLSCLDFENPSVRSFYNSEIIDGQISCRGALAIPWHADLNRDGTAAETEENRQTLHKLKAWVEYRRTHPNKEEPLPRDVVRAEEEKAWGEGVDDLSIRARVNRSDWPAGMPQVVSFDGRDLPGVGKASWGTVNFASVPLALEVEVNSQWYALAKEAAVSVCGDWNAYHGNRWQDLQLDGRWRRKTDGQPLELKPGSYTVRVAVSRTPAEKRTGLATSKPVKFEVIATE
jgi:hypothetical protein